jgi:hypothetical protein
MVSSGEVSIPRNSLIHATNTITGRHRSRLLLSPVRPRRMLRPIP